MDKILLIEDTPEVQKLVCASIGQGSVTCAGTLAHARELLLKEKFGLILLDVSLPDGNGFDFFGQIKNMPGYARVPIIFLTARSEVSEKVMGFSLGADDYITKPFSPLELRARVRARLEKEHEKTEQASVIELGDLRLDLLSQRAYLRKTAEEERLDLTPLEFQLLAYFARHLENILPREQLLDQVWGREISVLDRTVDTHVSSLRRKIQDSEFTIKTAYGQGYQFVKTDVLKKRAG